MPSRRLPRYNSNNVTTAMPAPATDQWITGSPLRMSGMPRL
jgi:hypothetical protein